MKKRNKKSEFYWSFFYGTTAVLLVLAAAIWFMVASEPGHAMIKQEAERSQHLNRR